MAKKGMAFAERLVELVREEYNSSRGDLQRRGDILSALLAITALFGMQAAKPGAEEQLIEVLSAVFSSELRAALAVKVADAPPLPSKSTH